MPLYRFDIESPLAYSVVLERLRGLVRERPGFRQALKESFSYPAQWPPFIGAVDGDTLKVRLNSDGRQRSLLPLIRGQVEAVPGGTRIHVGMSLHPGNVIILFVFLGMIGFLLRAQKSVDNPWVVFAVFCVLMVAATLVEFVPQVIKTRRILEEKLGGA